MLKKIFTRVFFLISLLLVASTASATSAAVVIMASNNNNAGGQQALPQPTQADLMFVIDDKYIKYRVDGYMLVCHNGKQGNFFDTCDNSSPTRTLEEFWKTYFPQAPTMKMVGMSYSVYIGKYMFWLKR